MLSKKIDCSISMSSFSALILQLGIGATKCLSVMGPSASMLSDLGDLYSAI